MESYWYAYGYKRRETAMAALEIAFSRGDVMPGEMPRIESYRTNTGAMRFGIKLN